MDKVALDEIAWLASNIKVSLNPVKPLRMVATIPNRFIFNETELVHFHFRQSQDCQAELDAFMNACDVD